jgi:hypothetical protein
MVRSEGNVSLKNPVTPPGIYPGTVRLVAKRFNHYDTPGPLQQLNYLLNLFTDVLGIMNSKIPHVNLKEEIS